MIKRFYLTIFALGCIVLFQNAKAHKSITRKHENIIVGIYGSELTKEIKEKLLKINPTGIIFIGMNKNVVTTEQTKNLIHELKDLLGQNIIIAIDCEGGRVNTLKFIDSPLMSKQEIEESLDGAEQLGNTRKKVINPLLNIPSAKYFGDLYDENPEQAKKEIYDHFARVSKIMFELGITHNFAPVLDLNCLTLDKYERSYGNVALKIEDLTKSAVKAMIDNGIIPALKHFPGLHLVNDMDTHDGIAISDCNMQEIDQVFELYGRLCDFIRSFGKVPMVMLNHGVYNAIDKVKSVSANIDFFSSLHKKLGSDVIIITDDLDMKGVSGDLQNLIKKTKNKGNTYLLFCHSLVEGWPNNLESFLIK